MEDYRIVTLGALAGSSAGYFLFRENGQRASNEAAMWGAVFGGMVTAALIPLYRRYVGGGNQQNTQDNNPTRDVSRPRTGNLESTVVTDDVIIMRRRREERRF